MMDYGIGDVVNVLFPNQEDSRRSTFRPAIVIEDLQDQVELLFLTKQTHQLSRYKDSFVITMESREGIAMGLTFDSLIAPHRKILFRKLAIIPPPRGKCPDELIGRLEELIENG